MLAQKIRYAGLDGRPVDLEGHESANQMPWISESWSPSFGWRGQGELPEDQAARLKSIVTKAHAQGRRVRFWGAPDNVASWRALQDAGVDLINTDDLPGLAGFLNRR